MRKAISVTRRKASGKLQIHCYYELTLKGRPFKRGKSQLQLQFNGPANKYISDNHNCQADSILSTKYTTKYYHYAREIRI